jgi:hypothetical protein
MTKKINKMEDHDIELGLKDVKIHKNNVFLDIFNWILGK